MRLVRRDGIAGQEQLERPPLANQPRQPLGPGIPGHEAEIDLRLAEPGRIGGNPDRAGHRQLASAAERDPLIAAMTGLPIVSIRSRMCWPRCECSRPPTGVCTASSLMSAPAMKALSPAPVTITARTASSCFSARIARRSSSSVSLLSALRFSGRLMVTTATAVAVDEEMLVGHIGSGYISQPRTSAAPTKPPNIRPPSRSCSRGSSRISTAKTSETKNANSTSSRKWLRPSLAAHRNVEGVENDQRSSAGRRRSETRCRIRTWPR